MAPLQQLLSALEHNVRKLTQEDHDQHNAVLEGIGTVVTGSLVTDYDLQHPPLAATPLTVRDGEDGATIEEVPGIVRCIRRARPHSRGHMRLPLVNANVNTNSDDEFDVVTELSDGELKLLLRSLGVSASSMQPFDEAERSRFEGAFHGRNGRDGVLIRGVQCRMRLKKQNCGPYFGKFARSQAPSTPGCAQKNLYVTASFCHPNNALLWVNWMNGMWDNEARGFVTSRLTSLGIDAENLSESSRSKLFELARGAKSMVA